MEWIPSDAIMRYSRDNSAFFLVTSVICSPGLSSIGVRGAHVPISKNKLLSKGLRKTNEEN